MTTNKLILLTGATGYIGGRLLKALETQGWRVRCLARQPEFLQARIATSTEAVAGDVLDSASLDRALSGVDTAYYLVHSMQRGSDFSAKDRQAAQNFGTAARAAGVRRIIYVGALGDDQQELSAHLRSRHEVGDVLRASGVPVLEFRASIIIGSGSLSFELIRALVERLPAMIMPRWVNVIAQPIAINDILAYLVAGLDVPLAGNHTFEIGGADCVSYGDIMREYARQRGLKRLMIPVPMLTPKLSSLWLGLVTPLYARVGRILVDSMRHETVVRSRPALEIFPIRPMGIREAIAAARRNEDQDFAQTRWSDSLTTANPRRDWGGVRFGNRIVDTRTITVATTAAAAFRSMERIGGTTGWYFGNALWQLRGWLDLLVGGVGMRRGRRDAHHLLPGDVVDCWRVESIESPRHLRFTAEMKLPGRAWLEFSVQPTKDGVMLRQTATFDPVGLWGLAYWYALFPLHEVMFRGMIRNLGRAALVMAAEPKNASPPAPEPPKVPLL
jgi:uncharacterized protein YbjT (DUF2867 family)